MASVGATRALWPRSGHAYQVFDKMTTWLQGSSEGANHQGDEDKDGEGDGHAGLVLRASVQCRLERCRISAMHPVCLIKCQGYQTIFVGCDTWYNGVSLDNSDDSGVLLAKGIN